MPRTANKLLPLVAVAALLLSGCGGADPSPTPDIDAKTIQQPPASPVRTIAFGSCVREQRPAPIFDAILAADPDLFIFLGDNIYADTTDMQVMRDKYADLLAKPAVAKLFQQATILATWDDHDYGENDAGAEYSKRAESQQMFLDFFGEPADTQRRRTPGIYDAETFGPEGKRLQVILLDTRYFRSPLKGRSGSYQPVEDPEATMLGEAQWQWLEGQLRQPADLRIIASSIQFIATEHGWEKWANFPRERRRLLDLIQRTQAEGVVFISGDRHSGEISMMAPEAGSPYPKLVDITASSFNSPRRVQEETNRHRVGPIVFDVNFGLIHIDWQAATLTAQLHDVDGRTITRQQISFDALRPASTD